MVKKITITKGIFVREVPQPEDLAEFFEWVGSMPKNDDAVRVRLSKAIAYASDVLEKAGHPATPGRYRLAKKANGERAWQKDKDWSEEEFPSEGTIGFWPLFIEAEPLTLVEFAVKLISAAQNFLGAIETGKDGWEVAEKALIYSDAAYEFGLEYRGIAAAAFTGFKNMSGRNKGRENKSRKSRQLDDTIEMLARSVIQQLGNMGSTLLARAVINLAKQQATVNGVVKAHDFTLSQQNVKRRIERLRREGRIQR